MGVIFLQMKTPIVYGKYEEVQVITYFGSVADSFGGMKLGKAVMVFRMMEKICNPK